MDTLPPEIVQYLLSEYLSIPDILNFCDSDLQYNDICSDNRFWDDYAKKINFADNLYRIHYKRLEDAIQHRIIPVIEAYLRHPRFNSIALEYAIKYDHVDIIVYILDHISDSGFRLKVGDVGDYAVTLLTKGHPYLAKSLLVMFPDDRAVGDFLAGAIAYGYYDIVSKYLIDRLLSGYNVLTAAVLQINNYARRLNLDPLLLLETLLLNYPVATHLDRATIVAATRRWSGEPDIAGEITEIINNVFEQRRLRMVPT